MSDVWVSEPRKPPHRCRRSGRHAPVDGPYFEDAVPYAESGGDDRTLTQYISVGWLRAIAAAPGSPIDIVTKADNESTQAALSAQADRIAELEAEAEELRAEREALLARIGESSQPIDAESLTNGIVSILDARYARKSGPKPKAAA